MQRFSRSEAKKRRDLVKVVEYRNKNIIIEPGLLKEYMNILFSRFYPDFSKRDGAEKIASR